MHFNIVSNLGGTVKDTGFSIDELVVRMQELFNRKAFPELLREILMMFDEMMKLMVTRKCPIPFSCGCGGDLFVLDGTRARKIRTPIGTVDIPSPTLRHYPFLTLRSLQARGLRPVAARKAFRKFAA